MKMKTQKSIVLKRNMKKVLTTLPPIAKKMIRNKINQIKSRIMQKIRSNKLKKRQNIPKKVTNRGIKSLKNNFSFNVTKNIFNAPKIVIEKPQIVTKPELVTSSKVTTKPKNVSKLELVISSKIATKPQIVTKPELVISSKIATKPKKVSKPKVIDKPEIVNEKKYISYNECKNRVIKQLKHRFDTKKKQLFR